MQDQDTPLSADEKQAPELVDNAAGIAAEQVSQPADEPSVDSLPNIAEQLRQAELKAVEHHDAWLRAKAETENVRRRAQDDIAKAGKFAADKFAQAMLPVKDSLEAALATENATLDSLKQGVELTLKQLISAFQGANVVEVNPVGEKFDPNKHQAISAIEADGEPNTVINVLQKGYLLHDRTIRPALVVVSKAKSAA
ncbi:nucleotide exchange factor GrpE [Zoogloea sp.]|uniref:nucleotide exchange factor GrpE n=1 Tax=Zoogloea sp. TaxID=49181 RepID=UPI0035B35059